MPKYSEPEDKPIPSDPEKKPIQTSRFTPEHADYYVEEWEREFSAGWIIRQISERTGLSLTDAMLYLNWLERFAHTAAVRDQSAQMAKVIPLQLEMLEAHKKESSDEESWKEDE